MLRTVLTQSHKSGPSQVALDRTLQPGAKLTDEFSSGNDPAGPTHRDQQTSSSCQRAKLQPARIGQNIYKACHVGLEQYLLWYVRKRKKQASELDIPAVDVQGVPAE